jgi:hypothetical protein
MPEDRNEEILAALAALQIALAEVGAGNAKIVSRLDQLVASHNQVGENIAWLTANTQGIFAMLNDPKFISQMMGGMLTGAGRGMPNDGQGAGQGSAG